MTHEERERRARQWIVRTGLFEYADKDVPSVETVSRIEALTELLADIERAVLEEAAKRIIAEHRMGDRDAWIDVAVSFRQRAKAIRS